MNRLIEDFAASHNCIIGICDALPLEEERARLLATDTPFVIRDIEKRINPALSLPGAKSVIVLGKKYIPSPYYNLSSLGTCVDYHTTVKAILKELAKLLSCNNTIMVDSGPLAERAFAVKAGLGFWGKNGMVISPLLGSFFNIGLLITDLALTPAKPCNLKCPDNCRLCLEACPANAIGKPTRCISYITQKKGQLTEAEVKLMDTQLYGCDLCQVCCPINKAAAPSLEENPSVFLSMDEEAYKARFGHTAMAWRGLKHLQRNAGIQLAKKGDNKCEKYI